MEKTKKSKSGKFAQLIGFISRKNIKTGPCGSVQIGSSVKETFASCKCANCPLLPNRSVWENGIKKTLKGNFIARSQRKKEGMTNRISNAFGSLLSCYAQSGSQSMAASSLNKAFAKKPDRYSITEMFNQMTWSMNFVRIGTIGDPCKADPKELDLIRKLAKERNKTAFGYTHGWNRKGMEKQADLLRASCFTIEGKKGAKEAIKLGFKASMVIEHKEGEKLDRIIDFDGLKGRICDFYSDEYLEGKKNVQRTDCSNCLQCDPKGKTPDLILFPSHK